MMTGGNPISGHLQMAIISSCGRPKFLEQSFGSRLRSPQVEFKPDLSGNFAATVKVLRPQVHGGSGVRRCPETSPYRGFHGHGSTPK